MSLESLSSNAIISHIQNNPLAVGLGVGAVALGTGAVIGAVAIKSRTKKRKTNKRHSKKKHPRHQKYHQHYGVKETKIRRKKKVSRRKGIHYTKKGQPYIILKSGKARFVKKTKRRAR